MIATLARHRFTVDEYESIIQAQVLVVEHRYELIEGDIVEMAALGSRHISSVIGLTDVFSAGLGAAAFVSVQNAVVLSEHSEPEPDIAILVRRPDQYRDRVPTVADVLLIVEVADPSLAFDRETKIGMYARAGIAESWLLALREDRLIVYRDPAPDGYRTMLTFVRGARVAPLAFPDLTLDVADMLGGPETTRATGRGGR